MSGPQPRKIGPYRIEGRLGTGGMGEVYRAYDERLDRWVAVKLIRPEMAGHEKALERFRREARAAARLNHPAIIQIYDVLQSEEGDAIVMEAVEGPTLARLIRDGPLAPDRALRLAQRIAEGLAAAHAEGIVHRDLKAENVVITPAGDAKILDFGLAKRFRQTEAEASVTLEGAVVGTYRAMSPEQARALRVDHRSDLFSFGTLLYEMLTGRSPFAGEAALDVLTKICTLRQLPVQELNPQVPEPLANLVDHLLEKDPACRPQSAQEVVAALEKVARSLAGEPPSEAAPTLDGGSTMVDDPRKVLPPRPPPGRTKPLRRKRFAVRLRHWALPVAGVSVLTAAVLLLVPLLHQKPLYVAVLKPVISEREGDDQRVDRLAYGVREALLRGLLLRQGIRPKAEEEVDSLPGSSSPTEVARAVAAEEVATTQLQCDTEICKISFSRIQGTDASLLWTGGFSVGIDDPASMNKLVEQQLGQAYAGRPVLRQTPKEEISDADYEDYLRMRYSFESTEEEKRPVDELLASVTEIRKRSPQFLDTLIFHAKLLRYRYTDRGDPADLQRALILLRQAHGQAPTDVRPLLSWFDAALVGNLLGQAEEALRMLEQLEPGQPVVQAQSARLLFKRGDAEDKERAIQLMRATARRMPSQNNLSVLSYMEIQRGEYDEARVHLRELLDRFPENRWARSKLAEIELANGDPKRAVELYEDLVRRSPQFTELANLGTAHMVLKQYAEAEERFRQARDLAPRQSPAVLGLADVIFLQGRKREAEKLYKKVLELTEPSADATDPQLWTIRAQALVHLGRNREAVKAVQKALTLRPDDPQVSLWVSLVYTVMDDRNSALYNAEQALKKGIAPGWFAFPWFDPLEKELQELIKQHAGSEGQ